MNELVRNCYSGGTIYMEACVSSWDISGQFKGFGGRYLSFYAGQSSRTLPFFRVLKRIFSLARSALLMNSKIRASLIPFTMTNIKKL